MKIKLFVYGGFCIFDSKLINVKEKKAINGGSWFAYLILNMNLIDPVH